jgi:hypothetical protein
LIRQKYNLSKLSKTTVQKLYKGAKISYKIPRYEYFAKQRKAAKIKDDQLKFTENIFSGNMVVFIDETTFNLLQRPSRIWQGPL